MNDINYSERLNKLIPGGTHTYSRGDDQYPANAPQILDRGKGAYVWDAAGNRFLDYGMGLRSVTVGYDYDYISEGAIEQIRKGNNLTRSTLIELEAAETMINLFPHFDMVKFAKNGSIVTTAAIKLSRAFTGKKYVAFCSEHPFFTYDDWFIGTTPMSKGVPEENKALSLKFHYNNIQSLQALFDKYPNQIACIILEPATVISPEKSKESVQVLSKPEQGNQDKTNNFLHQVQELCRKNNAVFILDEMITGFRWDIGGAQKTYDIEPDLATFGKGMANGFALAALAGKKEIMELGGIKKKGEERVFLISTTHGSEMSGFGAFVKTVNTYKSKGVTDHLWSYGEKLMNGVNSIARNLKIADYFYMHGYTCSPYYTTKDINGNISLPHRTLFSQELIKNGVLMPWVALSYSHTQEELNITLHAVEKALAIYAQALEDGTEKYLKGEAIKPVFRQFN